MKRRFLFLFIAVLGLSLAACNSEGLNNFTLVTEGDHGITQNFNGELFVLGGKLTIPEGIVLNGSAHVLDGSLIIAGEISGDVSFWNGSLILEPTARIAGDLNVASESYHPSTSAIVRGDVNTGVLIPDLPEQEVPDGWTLLLRSLVNGSVLGLAAMVMMRYIPMAVQRVGRTAVHHTLVSGAMGLLVAIVGVSLLITMAYTILLIPVTLLGLFVMGIGVLYGWVALGISFGRWVIEILKWPVRTSSLAFFGTLGFSLVLEVLSSIPVVGGLIGILMAIVGLGAATLTRMGLRPFVPAEY